MNLIKEIDYDFDWENSYRKSLIKDYKITNDHFFAVYFGDFSKREF